MTKKSVKKKTSKKATPNGLVDSGTQTATVPAEGKINRALTILSISFECEFFKNIAKNENHDGTGHAGTQNATVPGRAKIHRTLAIL